MSIMPSLKEDHMLERQMRETLLRYVAPKGACGHASFARVFQYSTFTGFIGANLVPNQMAERMLEELDARFIFDPSNNRPLSDSQVREANKSGIGSCLLITATCRSTPERAQLEEFLAARYHHLIRWFEGNIISSIALTFRTKYEDHYSGLINSLQEEMYNLVPIPGDRFLLVMKAPYRPRSSQGTWVGHLLRTRERPDVYYPDKHKLISRMFYEFDFVDEAVIPNVPTWARDNDKLRDKIDLKWAGRYRMPDDHFSKVSEVMGLNTPGKKVPVRPRIRRLIEENPRILTLY